MAPFHRESELMDLRQALRQISEIHSHVSRGEVYRGYRAVPAALAGAIAVLAAAGQPWIVQTSAPRTFVAYWVAIAALTAAAGGGRNLYNYLFYEDPQDRRRTRTVVGQFAPSLVAGALATAAAAAAGDTAIALLPGLWTLLFGMGIFASRPYLPRLTGFVALFYFAAGALLLGLARSGASLNPWGMGLSFGLGETFMGIVLYWSLER